MPVNEKEYPKGRSLTDILLELSKNMVMKAFHPKSIAYDAIRQKIAETLGDESGGAVPEDPEDPTNPGDTEDYFIWPEDGGDSKQVEEIASSLQRYATGNSKLESSNTEGLGLNYWRISALSVDKAMEIANLTNVSFTLASPHPPMLTQSDRSLVSTRYVAVPATKIPRQQSCTRIKHQPIYASCLGPTIFRMRSRATSSTKAAARGSRSMFSTQEPDWNMM
jgi:hypothetical protein